MDRVLNLVYDNYLDGMPLPNGLHPAVVAHVRANPTQKTALINSELSAFRDHNNFRLYIKKHHSCVDVTLDSIQDNLANIYPIEIKTTLSSIWAEHTFTLDGTTYTYSLADILSPALVQLINQGKVKILINYIHDPINNIEDIQRIESYFESKRIDPSNIIIVSGNSFKSYTGKIKICKGHLFEQQAAEKMLAYPHMSSLGYVSDNVKPADLDASVLRSKKFISFNRQMANRQHRVVLAHLSLKYDLLKDGYFSFVGSVSNEEISSVLIKFGLDNNTDAIQQLLPLEIDTQHLQVEKKTAFTTNNNKKELYLDSYIHLTTETGFDSTDVFFSEKTFRPIVNLQPFISIGNAGCLKDLRDLGFQTFHPYINETYDFEINPIRRMKMIETELNKIASMPMEQIHRLYYDLTSTLKHNQEHLKTFKDTDPYRDIIEVI